MERVDQVAAALRRAGEIPLEVVRSSIPELEDDSIELADGNHVQVGDTYVILVVPLPDGALSFFAPAASIDHLMRQIAEARAERARLGAAPSTPADDDGSARPDPPAAARPTLPNAHEERFGRLPTRDELLSAGARVHHSPVDDADYALFAAGTPRTFAVLRFDASGVADVTAESITPAGAASLLTGYLDGSHQASADRFFAYLDRAEQRVRPEVAEPLRAAGYWVCHTGGGCLAWIRHLSEDGDSHLLISTNDRIDGDPDAEIWDIGRYDGDGWVNLNVSFTLRNAIEVAALLPAAIDARGEPVQEVYADLDAARAALPPATPDDTGG